MFAWNIVSGEITETMHKEWVKIYREKRSGDAVWFHVKELV